MSAGTVAAVLALAMRAVVVVDQRGDVGIDAQDDRPAGAAVAAVGTTQRLELFAVDRGHSIAAPTGGDVECDSINKCGNGHGTFPAFLVRICRRNFKPGPS